MSGPILKGAAGASLMHRLATTAGFLVADAGIAAGRLQSGQDAASQEHHIRRGIENIAARLGGTVTWPQPRAVDCDDMPVTVSFTEDVP